MKIVWSCFIAVGTIMTGLAVGLLTRTWLIGRSR